MEHIILTELKEMQDDRARRREIWRHNGERLGYPSCCIESFCTQEPVYRTQEQQIIADLLYGFIPCPSCADKVVYAGLPLEWLIDNRDPSFPPFPLF